MTITKLKFLPSLAAIAIRVSEESKDTTKVGAVLVKDNVPLISMFNGPVPGVADLPNRQQRPEKYLWCAHAEQNLIATAARLGMRTDGLALVSTHHPCASCADTIIVAGIREVVYITAQFDPSSEITKGLLAARAKFKETGVKCTQYKCI